MQKLACFVSLWLLLTAPAFSGEDPVTSSEACSEPIALESVLLNFSLPQMTSYFRAGETKSLRFRLRALSNLEQAIRANEKDIITALRLDLGKPSFESLATEVAFVYEEISIARKNLSEWMRPVRVRTPLTSQPATSTIYRDPKGVVLILGPWNYPFQLVMGPLVGAIAGGNGAVVKPSEISKNTAAVINKILSQAFDSTYIAVQEGGPLVSAHLTSLPFDHIFFTGGAAVGKKILAAASAHLTPVTLELGGKSPVIVTHDANIDLAAKRILWGCNLNAGQTCVRPDYIIVDSRVKEELIGKIRYYTRQFYGDNPAESPDFGRIVNEHHFDRLVALLGDGEIVIGGQHDRSKKYIAPTFITNVSPGSPLLNEEIFGPITPILEFDGTLEAATKIIDLNPNPLALYCFTRSRAFARNVICSLPYGGGAINDVVMHINNPRLPFGGVGQSGMGNYHGVAGFNLFTREKAMVEDHHGVLLDLAGRLFFDFRFPPYTDFKEWVFRLLFG